MNNISLHIALRRFLLVIIVGCLFGADAFGNSNEYFAKLTARITGNTPNRSGAGTVYVNVNGATGPGLESTGSKAAGQNSDVELTVQATPATGFHLVGWYQNDNPNANTASLSTSTSYTANYRSGNEKGEDKAAQYNIYALFAYNTYTVEYDPNGGNGIMDSQNFTYNTPGNLRMNSFTRDFTLSFNTGGGTRIDDGTYQATFQKWTYGGAEYEQGQEVSNLSATHNSTVTMIAKWGGVNAVLPKPVKNLGGADYVFTGWYDDNNGYLGMDGSTLTLSEDRTIYAHWKEHDIIISVTGTPDKNGDRVVFNVVGPQNITYNIPVEINPNSRVVLRDVPEGNYTITANAWAWNYTVTGITTQAVNSDTVFDFTVTSKNSGKEHSEKSTVKQWSR